MGALKHCFTPQCPSSLEVHGSSAATSQYPMPAAFTFSTQLFPNLRMIS